MSQTIVRQRRELLKVIGVGAAATAIGACAPMNAGIHRYARPYSRNPFVAPRISMDSVIRVIVGHRPFRAAGFRVESEQFDDKPWCTITATAAAVSACPGALRHWLFGKRSAGFRGTLP